MKNLVKKITLSVCLLLGIAQPLIAKGVMLNSMEALANFIMTVMLVGLVLLLLPIVTAIMGVVKNKPSLKQFSKIYVYLSITILMISLVYNGFEALDYHLFAILIASIPLIILNVSKK